MERDNYRLCPAPLDSCGAFASLMPAFRANVV